MAIGYVSQGRGLTLAPPLGKKIKWKKGDEIVAIIRHARKFRVNTFTKAQVFKPRPPATITDVRTLQEKARGEILDRLRDLEKQLKEIGGGPSRRGSSSR